MTAPTSLPIETPETQQAFYVVSKRKFNILFYATLGSYLAYWSYRNWKAQKVVKNIAAIPILRGAFLIFFMHALLERVARSLADCGRSFVGDPRTLATTIVFLVILSNLADRVSGRGIGSPVTDLISLVLLPVLAHFCLSAQQNINVACNDEGGTTNSDLTSANWVWVVIGAILWLLVIVGIFLPPGH